MRFCNLVLPIVGFLAAGVTARPAREAVEARQLTSPSILQSTSYDIDVAVDAHAKAVVNVDEIFKNAKKNKELAVVTAGKVQKQVADLVAKFTAASYAVEGDLSDSIRRIGAEEASILKTCEDKIVSLAKSVAEGAKKVGENEEKDVVNLLKGENQAIMLALRSIFTPIEVFVKASSEDVGFPGILRLAKDDAEQAGKELDEVAKKFQH